MYTPGTPFSDEQDNYFTQVRMQQAAVDDDALKTRADADTRARQAAAYNDALKAEADADTRARKGSASASPRTKSPRTNSGTRFQNLLNRLKAVKSR